MVLKNSLMGPFRGHMSIKSSPFSPGSSCKLSSQYIIQDHMAMHYRKLLSAKAAVDSSAPKSLNMSIKYRDHQKREQLMKAVEKMKEEMTQVLSAPSCHSWRISMENNKGLLSRGRMPSLGGERQRSSQYLKQMHLSNESPVPNAKMIQNTVQWCLSQTPKNGRNRVQKSILPLTQPHFPLQSSRKTKMFLVPQKKTLGGDLLDTHAQCFTETKQPFTPRVLKAASKSFLSKYRYYNHPAGKKSFSLNPPSHNRTRKILR
uniref:Spermatogenesis-associated protein 7 homolog isoform X1 n=1 Tax=Pogona vitticeps TaxID=103695 RepID=A0ABM5FLP8_9SAUR